MKFGSAVFLLLTMTVKGAHIRSNGVRSETFEEGATHAGFKNGARTSNTNGGGYEPSRDGGDEPSRDGGDEPSRKIPGSRNHAGFKNGARTSNTNGGGYEPSRDGGDEPSRDGEPSRKIPGSRNHADFKNGARTSNMYGGGYEPSRDGDGAAFNNGARTPKGYSQGADPRIVGGSIAPTGRYPYYVDLDGCGGALIGNGGSQFVITAAHCLMAFNSFPIVDVGGLKNNNGYGGDGEQRQVVSYAIHHGYDQSNLKTVQSDDIAVLKLNSPVNVNSSLWLSSVSPAVGTSVVVPGHGLTQGWGSQSYDLLYATLYVKDDSECQHYQGYNGYKTICAGGSGMGICQGDSGGPLVMEADGFDWLVGVVSFSDTGCSTWAHDGFVEVAAYIDWIEDTIAGM